MKKLLLASLLVGSMAFASTAEHDTRSVGKLTVSEPCDIPVDCSSLSPLARRVCLLKGLGQGCLIAVCGFTCSEIYSFLAGKKLTLKGKFSYTGAVLAALVVGTDAFRKSAKNISAAIME